MDTLRLEREAPYAGHKGLFLFFSCVILSFEYIMWTWQKEIFTSQIYGKTE